MRWALNIHLIRDASGIRALSLPIAEPFYPASFNRHGAYATVRFSRNSPFYPRFVPFVFELRR
jgi:hypothetical protein